MLIWDESFDAKSNSQSFKMLYTKKLKQVLLLLCLLSQFISFSLSAASSRSKVDLKTQILSMWIQDQALRQKWNQVKGTDLETKVVQETSKLDRLHLIKLKEIIATYSWPGFALVGQEASHAMWGLVQHAPDVDFQKYCLLLMEQAAINGDASMEDLAFLTDRILMYEGKKQLYGTQLQLKDGKLIPYPIEDEPQVNARRKTKGLNSLESYFKEMHNLYKLQVCIE